MYFIDVNVIMLLLLLNVVLMCRCANGDDDDFIMYPEDDFRHSNRYHHPHESTFQHSPEFHRNHPNLPYPGHSYHYHHNNHHHHHSHNFPPEEKVSTSNLSSIPLEFILKYNNFNEVNDILHNLVEGNIQEKNGPILLESRFGDERNAAVVPKAANCMPELQTVHIAPTDDPSVIYIPSCTRIERCAGCCTHSLLSCQPVETETVSFQLFKTQFQGGSKLKFMSKEIVTVEKHTKCKCSCKVQAKHCNKFQEYRSNECSCSCTNRDEEKKCDKDSSLKLWNPEICVCQCRNIVQCSTGYQFDTLKCRCTQILLRRRYAELSPSESNPSKPQPLPVLPMQDEEDEKN
uniref:Platelet-derived growth factor (PDGF) family profile domain-containing protein n=1 Tax=Photinus pyralis TaxID=7054 RepID=A0A1Y1MBC8_PHOPY